MPKDMLSRPVVPAPAGRMHPFVTSPQLAARIAHFALDMPRMPSEASGHVWQLDLQTVDVFNDVMPKELALVVIDFRHSSLHCLVTTDASFLANQLNYVVDDVDFVHLSFSFGF